MRKNALLGAAFLLVPPRAAKGRVELSLIQRLAQRLGLHHLGVQGRSGGDWRNATLDALLIRMDKEIEAEPPRRLVAKFDHFAKLPGRIDMKKRKRRRRRMKGLQRDMQHRARILADRIKHDRSC